MSALCPCGTGKPYIECCKRYHEGAFPETALELMRSRYSAYAKHCADYIIETTHPSNSGYKTDKETWRKEVLYFCQNTSFDKLQILEFNEGPLAASVTFIAELRQNNRDTSFKEKSYFEKINGRWLYLSGILESPK